MPLNWKCLFNGIRGLKLAVLVVTFGCESTRGGSMMKRGARKGGKERVSNFLKGFTRGEMEGDNRGATERLPQAKTITRTLVNLQSDLVARIWLGWGGWGGVRRVVVPYEILSPKTKRCEQLEKEKRGRPNLL